MKVWTDFGQDQGQLDIDKIVFYQSTTDGEHMTGKSCDRVQNGLERLTVQKDQEKSRQELGLEVMSRDMGSSWCAHVQQRLRV